MGNQRAPDLCFYPVFRFRVEEVQLKVLLQLFECQLYGPPVFVNQSDFFGPYLPVVGDKLVFPAFFVLVINQTQTKSLFFLSSFIIQVDMFYFVNTGFFFFEFLLEQDFL